MLKVYTWRYMRWRDMLIVGKRVFKWLKLKLCLNKRKIVDKDKELHCLANKFLTISQNLMCKTKITEHHCIVKVVFAKLIQSLKCECGMKFGLLRWREHERNGCLNEL
jgi:hypothetical protein